MYCYVLQGVLGVLALAAIIAGSAGALWCVFKGSDYIERFSDKIDRTAPNASRIVNRILIGALVAAACILVSMLCWMLGGDLIKRFFHFCIG